jgi:hypothetical protein
MVWLSSRNVFGLLGSCQALRRLANSEWWISLATSFSEFMLCAAEGFRMTAPLNLSFRAKREIFPHLCTRNEINPKHYPSPRLLIDSHARTFRSVDLPANPHRLKRLARNVAIKRRERRVTDAGRVQHSDEFGFARTDPKVPGGNQRVGDFSTVGFTTLIGVPAA